MSELSDGTLLIITAIFVLAVFFLIFQIDRRVKREGALIKRDASPKSRLYAIIIGLLIGGFTLLEWMVGFRLYFLLLIAVALFAYGLGIDHLLEIFQSKKDNSTLEEIEGIDWITLEELQMLIQAGGKFVVFKYCVSVFLFVTPVGNSKVYFIKPGESYFEKTISYNTISIFFGWLSPIKLLQILKTNFSGGKDVTQEVMKLLATSSTSEKLNLL